MQNDFQLIQHKFDNDIIIVPISDVHLGAIEHNKTEWENFLSSVEEKDNIYFFLCGDLINNSTRNSVANPFDEIMRPREQKNKMVEYLLPIKDRILCAVSGNHEGRSSKDSDVDLTYDIMSKLGIEDLYRENIAFLKLSLGNRTDKSTKSGTKSCNVYTFGVTHGSGGGIYTGSAVNKNERFGYIIDGLDGLVVAHTHKGAVTRPEKIVIDANHNTVSRKPWVMVVSESWLNFGGYAARKMLLPAEGCNPPKLYLSSVNHNKKIEVRW